MLDLMEQAGAAYAAIDGRDPRRERLYGGNPPGNFVPTATSRTRVAAAPSPHRIAPPSPSPRQAAVSGRDEGATAAAAAQGARVPSGLSPQATSPSERPTTAPPRVPSEWHARGSDRHVQRVQSARRGRLMPSAADEEDGLREVPPWAERGGPLGGRSSHPPPGHIPTAAAGGAPAYMPTLDIHDGLATYVRTDGRLGEVLHLSADGLGTYARTEAEAAGAAVAGIVAQDSGGYWHTPHAAWAADRRPPVMSAGMAASYADDLYADDSYAAARTAASRMPRRPPPHASGRSAGAGPRRKPKPSLWGAAGTIDSGSIAAAIYHASLGRAHDQSSWAPGNLQQPPYV